MDRVYDLIENGAVVIAGRLPPGNSFSFPGLVPDIRGPYDVAVSLVELFFLLLGFGLGVRFFLPMLGMVELVYGYNFDAFDPVRSSEDGSERYRIATLADRRVIAGDGEIEIGPRSPTR